MPGPAPKPADQRRRRNAPTANVLKLPAEGRSGPAPQWPLGDDLSDAERDLWTDLWKTPAAVAWERLGWVRVVARYVHVLTVAEVGMSAVLLGEVRQLEDRLGLTPMAMLRLRWEVVADEVGAARAVKPKRPRLKAVDSGGVAGS